MVVEKFSLTSNLQFRFSSTSNLQSTKIASRQYGYIIYALIGLEVEKYVLQLQATIFDAAPCFMTHVASIFKSIRVMCKNPTDGDFVTISARVTLEWRDSRERAGRRSTGVG